MPCPFIYPTYFGCDSLILPSVSNPSIRFLYCLAPVFPSTAEKEEDCFFVRIQFIMQADQGSQSIDPQPAICISAGNHHLFELRSVGIIKHGWPPGRFSLNLLHGNPGLLLSGIRGTRSGIRGVEGLFCQYYSRRRYLLFLCSCQVQRNAGPNVPCVRGDRAIHDQGRSSIESAISNNKWLSPVSHCSCTISTRDFLGHSSVTTTEIYARSNPEIKRKFLEETALNIDSGIGKYSAKEKATLLDWLKNNI